MRQGLPAWRADNGRSTRAGVGPRPFIFGALAMSLAHLKALEEIEREGMLGLVEILCEGGIDAVRYVLWDATG